MGPRSARCTPGSAARSLTLNRGGISTARGNSKVHRAQSRSKAQAPHPWQWTNTRLSPASAYYLTISNARGLGPRWPRPLCRLPVANWKALRMNKSEPISRPWLSQIAHNARSSRRASWTLKDPPRRRRRETTRDGPVRAHPGWRAGLSKVQSVDQRMRLECGVGFRQLRTCRRKRPGQLCAKNRRIACLR